MKGLSLVVDELSKIVGSQNVSSDPSETFLYSMDVSVHNHNSPDIVVRPESTEHVSSILKIAFDNEVPVTPRGGGSGLSGGAIPLEGGIVLDMTNMDKILDIDVENRCVVVQAGVIHKVLNDELSKHGFFYPPDPSSTKMCTMGGHVAVGGSGGHSVKYGTVRNYVLGLTVILPNGEVIRTGGRTQKRTVGFDLTHLLIGSEGTLGVITEIILKIIPLPETEAVVVALFDTLEEAARSVVNIFINRITPASIEILDKSATKAINKYKPDLGLPECEGILFIEVDGSKEDVDRQAIDIRRVCFDCGATEVRSSSDLQKRIELWEGRNIVGVATTRLIDNYTRVYEGDDVCVPMSSVVAAVKRIREISKKHDIPIIIFGHIGDGNLHPAITIDKRNPEHWERLNLIVKEIHESALNLGGTIAGEHGVGISRADYMIKEHGFESLRLMKDIKKVFDPKGIMNPGKLGL